MSETTILKYLKLYKKFFHQGKKLYVQKRSTHTNLFCLIKIIIFSSFESGYQLDVTYTNFSKVFDLIDFYIFLSKD